MRASHYSGLIPCAASRRVPRGSPSLEQRDMDVDISFSANGDHQHCCPALPIITRLISQLSTMVIKSQSLPP